MKKITIFLSLLPLILITADSRSARLVRLTIVNKSGLKLEISLNGKHEDENYFLRIPAGDSRLPKINVFTIVPDVYQLQTDYIELWDPVYGSTCGSPPTQTIDAIRNVRVVVLECGQIPRSKEPSQLIISGNKASENLVRLTIVNKSDSNLEIRLTGETENNNYYLRVPEGNRILPTLKEFTVKQDTYEMQTFYVDIWDPIFGHICNESEGKTIDILRNIRIIVLECDPELLESDLPPIWKYISPLKYIY